MHGEMADRTFVDAYGVQAVAFVETHAKCIAMGRVKSFVKNPGYDVQASPAAQSEKSDEGSNGGTLFAIDKGIRRHHLVAAESDPI